MMAQVFFFVSFLLTNLAVLLSALEHKEYKHCKPFSCNDEIGRLSFPFKHLEDSPECGLFSVNCTEEVQKIQLKEEGYWYEFTNITNNKIISMIIDEELQQRLENNTCDDESLRDLSFQVPSARLIEPITNVKNLLNCSSPILEPNLEYCSSTFHRYYYNRNPGFPVPPQCLAFELPLLKGWNPLNQSNSNSIVPDFSIQVTISKACLACFAERKVCRVYEDEHKPTDCLRAPTPPSPAASPPKPNNVGKRKSRLWLWLWLGLGFGLGVPAFLAACFFIFWCYRKRRASKKMVLPSNTPNSNLEGRSFYKLGVPVFTYKELEEATNHFHCDKEIGDGGFGIVYHGNLKDGREVAVKRLYEHNCRRAEQFMNEIEILTHLCHKNLVTLYGCTSRHSRDLLLVYEYISNGTVADHLHGDRAASGLLTWPMRMSIAKETASALCYLHASDIVHRDVKTTNILLDKNFIVKVADFGISRIFPLHATHVSTAPQGTPGYVDPEYHQCYQLTPKSDVYSFGVVLIELISSLPAVDITRHREEINLSNLAINRIRNGLYTELVDSSLGFESDDEVKRMTIAVAELAFRCLQQDSNARPAMWEVLEDLKNIENPNGFPRMKKSIGSSPSPYSDQIGLLKSTKRQSSPSSVIQNWTSTNSTATNSSA